MSLVIKQLNIPKTNIGIDTYIYKDVSLDFELGNSNNDSLLIKKKTGKDLKPLIDESAIINSLRNLFLTRKGQKILAPTYGLNFEDYLFTTVSAINANIIGEQILSEVSIFEPRVRLNQVNVIPDIDNNQYTIYLNLSIPILNNKIIPFAGILTSGSFN